MKPPLPWHGGCRPLASRFHWAITTMRASRAVRTVRLFEALHLNAFIWTMLRVCSNCAAASCNLDLRGKTLGRINAHDFSQTFSAIGAIFERNFRSPAYATLRPRVKSTGNSIHNPFALAKDAACARCCTCSCSCCFSATCSIRSRRPLFDTSSTTPAHREDDIQAVLLALRHQPSLVLQQPA